MRRSARARCSTATWTHSLPPPNNATVRTCAVGRLRFFQLPTFRRRPCSGLTNMSKPAYNLVISNVPGPRTTQYFNGADSSAPTRSPYPNRRQRPQHHLQLVRRADGLRPHRLPPHRPAPPADPHVPRRRDRWPRPVQRGYPRLTWGTPGQRDLPLPTFVGPAENIRRPWDSHVRARHSIEDCQADRRQPCPSRRPSSREASPPRRPRPPHPTGRRCRTPPPPRRGPAGRSSSRT